MKPIDANRADWRLYYNGTFMQHVRHGPMYIVVDGDLYGKVHGGRNRAVDGADVLPMWVRPGAYNIGRSAYYLGRRARRSARRSMSTEHYTIKWSSAPMRMGTKYLWAAIRAEDYPTFAEAMEELTVPGGEVQARAISRDMILSRDGRTKGAVRVILRGQDAGQIKDNLFIPHHEIAPLAKLVRTRLTREGVLC